MDEHWLVASEPLQPGQHQHHIVVVFYFFFYVVVFDILGFTRVCQLKSPVSYLECDLVIYLENHLSRSNEIVMALPRNMISLQQLPFLHPSHLAVAFIDRTPLPFIEEGSVKNMFYCLFTHLVLFY